MTHVEHDFDIPVQINFSTLPAQPKHVHRSYFNRQTRGNGSLRNSKNFFEPVDLTFQKKLDKQNLDFYDFLPVARKNGFMCGSTRLRRLVF